MIKVRASLQCIIALSIALVGIKLLFPEYNRNVFGDPHDETLRMQCQIPSTEAIIRLYEGTGGMLVADRYSLTLFEGGKSSKEKQIFYTYSTPSIKSISCRKDRVEIFTYDQTFKLTLTLEKIKNELIEQPMTFYRGYKEKAYIPPLWVRVLPLILGIFLELISIWILIRSVKQVRAFQNPELDPPMNT
jgi:hypothetical protein